MTKVLCPAAECIHYKSGRCSAKEVPLRQWIINTVHEGQKTMWECKSYEISDRWKELEKIIEDDWKEISKIQSEVLE